MSLYSLLTVAGFMPLAFGGDNIKDRLSYSEDKNDYPSKNEWPSQKWVSDKHEPSGQAYRYDPYERTYGSSYSYVPAPGYERTYGKAYRYDPYERTYGSSYSYGTVPGYERTYGHSYKYDPYERTYGRAYRYDPYERTYGRAYLTDKKDDIVTEPKVTLPSKQWKKSDYSEPSKTWRKDDGKHGSKYSSKDEP